MFYILQSIYFVPLALQEFILLHFLSDFKCVTDEAVGTVQKPLVN